MRAAVEAWAERLEVHNDEATANAVRAVFAAFERLLAQHFPITEHEQQHRTIALLLSLARIPSFSSSSQLLRADVLPHGRAHDVAERGQAQDAMTVIGESDDDDDGWEVEFDRTTSASDDDLDSHSAAAHRLTLQPVPVAEKSFAERWATLHEDAPQQNAASASLESSYVKALALVWDKLHGHNDQRDDAVRPTWPSTTAELASSEQPPTLYEALAGEIVAEYRLPIDVVGEAFVVSHLLLLCQHLPSQCALAAAAQLSHTRPAADTAPPSAVRSADALCEWRPASSSVNESVPPLSPAAVRGSSVLTSTARSHCVCASQYECGRSVSTPHLSSSSLNSIFASFAQHATVTRGILAFIDNQCSACSTTARCHQRLGDSLLAYVNRYLAWLTAMQDGLDAGAVSSLLSLTDQFHPFVLHMDAVLATLKRLTDGGSDRATAVDSARLLSVLFDAYSTACVLEDGALTALFLCLFLDALEPYLDMLDTVRAPITQAARLRADPSSAHSSLCDRLRRSG